VSRSSFDVAGAQRRIVKRIAATRVPSAGDSRSAATAEAMIHAGCGPIEGSNARLADVPFDVAVTGPSRYFPISTARDLQ